MRDPGSKRERSSVQDGHVLCPLDEEQPVGFTGAAVPMIEAKALDRPPPALEIGEPPSADQPSAREDQKSELNTDILFDAHAAGWEVVDGTRTAYESPHSPSDHSDLTEDKSTTYEQSKWRKQRQLHEAKGKHSVPIVAPHVHPDDFEDPISDEFWNRVWVACAEHNVSTCLFGLLTYLGLLALADGNIPQGIPCDSGRYGDYLERIQAFCCLP